MRMVCNTQKEIMKKNTYKSFISTSLAAAVLAIAGCATFENTGPENPSPQASHENTTTGTSKPATPIETTGEPGSPGATTTISGNQLPPPDPEFGGLIKENAAQSKAWWAPRIVPPKQAPNVL